MTCLSHYDDVIMGAMASQITSLTIVYSTVYSDADQRKHQSSASLAFVWGIHRGPVNSPHNWPVTRKKVPFDDVIMYSQQGVTHDIKLCMIPAENDTNKTTKIDCLLKLIQFYHMILCHHHACMCEWSLLQVGISILSMCSMCTES